jgi:hypothetical protein
LEILKSKSPFATAIEPSGPTTKGNVLLLKEKYLRHKIAPVSLFLVITHLD